MELVENSLDADLEAFLERPRFCFLGTATHEGAPRVSPLWYLWEDGHVWIIADTVEKSYPARVEARPETAVAIVDYDAASGRVQHVGLRGTAAVVDFDRTRAERLLERYLGPRKDDWDRRFTALDPERWELVRIDPRTAVARDQSFAPSLDRRG